MNVYSISDIGLIRKNNQDYYCVKRLSDDEILAVVCDGMGGAQKGDVASQLAVESIIENFPDMPESEKIEKILLDAVNKSNKKVFEVAKQDPECHGMGTTVIAAFVKKEKINIVYAGDSRVYILSEEKIKQITKDHSLVQEMCDSGEITKKEMRNHPRKNILTRALGIGKTLDLDCISCEFNKNETLLICTDGLSNEISDEKIFKLYQNCNSDVFADKLIEAANQAGGNDNITVVVIKN